jgi:hypothetical protein
MRDKLCKNCVFFYISYGDVGFCNIQLPPWTNTEYADRQMHAESTCDLHKSKEEVET